MTTELCRMMGVQAMGQQHSAGVQFVPGVFSGSCPIRRYGLVAVGVAFGKKSVTGG